jgi:hypothetical protein
MSKKHSTYGVYLVSQDIVTGWDTYDSFICTAQDEEEARNLYPGGGTLLELPCFYHDWPGQDQKSSIRVVQIGISFVQDTQVVCASFNAG